MRRLVTFAAALSMLLCVATVALWVRSYWKLDSLYYVQDDEAETISVLASRGQIKAWLLKGAMLGAGWLSHESEPSRPYSWGSGFLGFGYENLSHVRVVDVPHWFLALLFAVPPTLTLRAAIRSRRRHRAGFCPTCGYDLRATPQRCPECGTKRV